MNDDSDSAKRDSGTSDSATSDFGTSDSGTSNSGATESATTETGAAESRDKLSKVFLRDAAVFHGKLLLDGFRDVVLFPVALITVLVDVVRRDDPPGRRFYDVVHFGKQTERWIDLFEAADRAPETDRPRPEIDGPSLDEFIDDFGQKLKDGHEKGELSASAKRTVEQILEAAKKAMDRSAGRS
jgi:hypothetical protein